jgi:hypothetical protein
MEAAMEDEEDEVEEEEGEEEEEEEPSRPPSPKLLRLHVKHFRKREVTYSEGVFRLGLVASSVADPDPGSGAFWTRGSGMGKKSDPDPEWVKSRIRIRDVQPGSCFRELRKPFFGLKYLNSLTRIRDGKNSDPGWKKFRSGIYIPDPQHWWLGP